MKLINYTALKEQMDKFDLYIHYADNSDSQLDFMDAKGIIAREEGYKYSIPERARTILNTDEWNEMLIGSGIIGERISKVIDMADNLINFNTKIDFKKHFSNDKIELNRESERVIYEIYMSSDDKRSFEHAINVFGAKYPILAYLFYVKDETKYLPVSPKNFDRAFRELDIDFTMSFNCSWENYCQFIDIVAQVGESLSQFLDISHEVRLLDAHSFIWIVGEEKYINWSLDLIDINFPVRPKERLTGEDGIIRYLCPRCGLEFKKNGRCPECGQAIKEQYDF